MGAHPSSRANALQIIFCNARIRSAEERHEERRVRENDPQHGESLETVKSAEATHARLCVRVCACVQG